MQQTTGTTRIATGKHTSRTDNLISTCLLIIDQASFAFHTDDLDTQTLPSYSVECDDCPQFDCESEPAIIFPLFSSRVTYTSNCMLVGLAIVVLKERSEPFDKGYQENGKRSELE
jgi:hypothetical protein